MAHRWSGWPGAYCLDCGKECQAEVCLAQNFQECRDAVNEEGYPAPEKCPIHGKGKPCTTPLRNGGHSLDEADPVHLNPDDQKWWFWMETWADRIGPYETQEEATTAFDKYCKEELAPKDPSVGKAEDALEESGADCEARKAVATGGEHQPGPFGGCPACIKIAGGMELTVYERDRYTEAWAAWHRQSMTPMVPLSVVIWHWSQAQLHHREVSAFDWCKPKGVPSETWKIYRGGDASNYSDCVWIQKRDDKYYVRRSMMKEDGRRYTDYFELPEFAALALLKALKT